jgi:hypothetical protein
LRTSEDQATRGTHTAIFPNHSTRKNSNRFNLSNIFPFSSGPASTNAATSSFTIGVLDTPGFENFKQNGIEQLYVNTLNEEMQSAFYRHSFLYDQMQYQREGLPYPQCNYRDNKRCIDLLLQVSCKRETRHVN